MMVERPGVLRWLGVFGSVCCAVDGLLFGAPTFIRRGVSVMSILRGPNGVLIMLLWIAGLAALCAAWWYGRRLLGRGLLTRRWIMVTAALWSLPMLIIPPLASRDMYAYACQGALFDAGLNPYRVGVSAQPCPWLESVSVVWRDTPAPYGPLFVLLAGAAAAFGSQAVALAVVRVYAVLAMLGLAAVLPVLARRLGVAEDRALWLVLCCPIVPVHLIGGGHNDALTMALLIAGLAVLAGAQRPIGAALSGPARPIGAVLAGPDRPVGALVAGGALIGLAIGVKTTVGVALPFAALLALAGTFSWPRLLRRGGLVVGGALGALLALSAVSGLGLGWATALSGAGESRSWTSPSTAVGMAVNAAAQVVGAEIDAVPATRLVALALLLVVLVVLWWRFRRAGDPLHGAGLACLAVIFLAPITQPWYLFWVLALLAVTRVPVDWLVATTVAGMFLILPNGDGAWRPLQVPLAFLMTALTGWVAYRAVRWLREPAAPAVAVE